MLGRSGFGIVILTSRNICVSSEVPTALHCFQDLAIHHALKTDCSKMMSGATAYVSGGAAKHCGPEICCTGAKLLTAVRQQVRRWLNSTTVYSIFSTDLYRWRYTKQSTLLLTSILIFIYYSIFLKWITHHTHKYSIRCPVTMSLCAN